MSAADLALLTMLSGAARMGQDADRAGNKPPTGVSVGDVD